MQHENLQFSRLWGAGGDGSHGGEGAGSMEVEMVAEGIEDGVEVIGHYIVGGDLPRDFKVRWWHGSGQPLCITGHNFYFSYF